VACAVSTAVRFIPEDRLAIKTFPVM
jgi:hypothetical protein